LTKRLESKDPGTVQIALNALEILAVDFPDEVSNANRRRFISLSKSGDPNVRKTAAKTLGNSLSRYVAPDVIEQAAALALSEELHPILWDNFQRLGVRALPYISAFLKHPVVRVRWEALQFIARHGEKGPPLTKEIAPFLDDPDFDMRCAAAHALVVSDPDEGLRILEKKIVDLATKKNTPEEQTRLRTLKLGATYLESKSAPLIRRLVSHENAKVRSEGLEIARGRGRPDPVILQVLRERLKVERESTVKHELEITLEYLLSNPEQR